MFSLTVRKFTLGQFPTIRDASLAREDLWAEIQTGLHPVFGADDFRDRPHFIERSAITAVEPGHFYAISPFKSGVFHFEFESEVLDWVRENKGVAISPRRVDPDIRREFGDCHLTAV